MATLDYVWSDIDIEVSSDASGDILAYRDVDAVKDSIINILSTSTGSRRMLPTFGCNLDVYLFEELSEKTAESIGRAAISNIQKWDSRLVLDKVYVNVDYDKLQYSLTIYYHLAGLDDTVQKISFILKNL